MNKSVVLFGICIVAGCSSHAPACKPLDSALISCPSPQAPRITELKPGKVVVRLTVQPDGSVSDAVVISSSGHPAWKEAVLQAVRKWHYVPSDQVTTKEVPFDFEFSG